MISDALLAILRCPEDRSELARAEPGLIAAINQQIEARQLRNRGGRTLEQPLEEGLVRGKGDVLYPVVDGIPRLLVEEGILLPQLDLDANARRS